MREPRYVDAESLQKYTAKTDARFEEHARILNRLRNLEAEVMLDKQLQVQREMTDKLQAHTMSYTNIVLGLGYAGFFAMWSVVDKYIPPWAHALSGMLMSLSLAVFIGWEVNRMIHSAVEFRALQKKLQGSVNQITLLQQTMQKIDARTGMLWPFVLIPCIVLAAGSGLLVLWCLSGHLLEQALS
jgi:hypothetical protein